MTEVVLDGPHGGWTTAESERLRALDCRVATAMGWVRHENGTKWRHHDRGTGDWEYRDEPLGVPFYSTDMNGAHQAFHFMARNWNYVAKQKFWELLQHRANFDPVVYSLPEYPDALMALADQLPEHICHAFADAFEYHQKAGLDPCKQSKRAAEFVDEMIERREFTDYDAEGNMVKRYNPQPKSTPWIKPVVD